MQHEMGPPMKTLWSKGYKINSDYLLEAIESLATLTPELIESVSSGERRFVFIRLIVEEESDG